MIANWQNFNIGSNASVNFAQPNASSVALNRIIGQDPSQIFGRLTANGQVMLVNAAGIVFGPNSQTNVGALVASTLQISDQNFLAGNYVLANSGNAGSIDNQGRIATADGGVVAFLAPIVNNSGSIETAKGSALLAAADKVTLDFSGDGLISYTLDQGVANALAKNSGSISSAGGVVTLTAKAADAVARAVVNNSGVIQASGLAERDGRIVLEAGGGDVLQQGAVAAAGGNIEIKADAAYFGNGKTTVASTTGGGGAISITTVAELDAVASHTFDASGSDGGQILLDGGETGNVLASSTFTADGHHGRGGRIDMTAAGLALLSAKISADGVNSGGSINIGGEWQGSGALRHAGYTLVNTGANLSARASAGVGGSIVAWSSQYTAFDGSANASGAVRGGQIEISSTGDIGLTGSLNAGAGGQVLLDPKNITIANIPATTGTWRRSAIAGNFGISAIGSGVDTRDFGQSLALDGDLLAIGYYSQDSKKGSVYLFTGANSVNYGSLALQARLGDSMGAAGMPALAGNGSIGDNFGTSISLNGGRLAVGAWGDTSYRGAVYLFDGVGTDFTGLTYQTKISSGSGATAMPTINASDFFGVSLSLNGDRLAVGAVGDDTGGSDRGAVYLFSGLNSANFGAVAYQAKITSGATGVATNMPVLANSNQFGYGVSLDGTLLAVGTPGDNLSGGNGAGAVHLFSMTNTSDFSGLTWRGKLGSGTTAVAAGMPTYLEGTISPYVSGDSFGRSVALSGGRLVVGASGDDTGNIGAGALYVFSGTGSDFSGLTYDFRIRSGQGATGMPTLGINDALGIAVALDGTHLAGGGQGLAHFFDLAANPSTSDSVASATYATNPGANSTIAPDVITAILNTGSAVTLQANNDITISNAIIANNTGGDGGVFNLMAGRNITINGAINTDNGSFTAVAGDPGANLTYKDVGTTNIVVNAGLNSGTGAINLTANNGAISGNTSGTITTSGANLTLNAGSGTGSLSGVVALGSGGLIKQGAGTTGLSGANTYTGTTTVDGGTLQVNHLAGLGTTASGTTVNSGATLFLGANSIAEAIALNGGTISTSSTVNFNGDITLGADSFFNIAASRLLTLSGIVGGAGHGFTTTTGTGTLILSGANTYSGTTTINAGTLQVGGGGTTGTLGSGGVTNSAALVFNRSNDLTVANDISGSGSVSKQGVGTTLLSGSNTYTGGTTVSGGTLFGGAGSGTRTAFGSGLVTINSGATLWTDGSTLSNNLALNGGTLMGSNGFGETWNGTVSLSGNSTVRAYGGGDTITFTNTVSGTGNLTKIEDGKLTLTGNNSYSGTTTISAGSLRVGNNGSSGTLGTGGITNNATLEFYRSNDLTVANLVSGSGVLAQLGAGTLTLTGNNSYTGATLITGGSLQVGNGGTTGTLGSGAALLFNANNNLIFNRSDSVSLSTLASNAAGITGYGNVIARIGGDFDVDRPITLTQIGTSSAITLAAGYNTAAGTTTGGNVTLTSPIATNATGTVTIFSGTPNTATLNGQITGAAGATKYKTYNANSTAISAAVTGTRNFYYRSTPSLTITGLTASKVYDGNNSAVGFTAGGTASGVDGDTVGASDLIQTSATFSDESVGSKTLNAAFTASANTVASGGWAVSGYSVNTFSDIGGTISKAPLTITANANADSKTYNGLTYSGGNGVAYTGFVNGETNAVLGGTLGYSGDSQGAVNAGSYTLTPEGLTAGNYQLSFNNGTLTIIAVPASTRSPTQKFIPPPSPPALNHTTTPPIVLARSVSSLGMIVAAPAPALTGGGQSLFMPQLSARGDAITLNIGGNSASFNSTLAVFSLSGDTIQPNGALMIRQEGQSLSATPGPQAGSASIPVLNVAAMRFVTMDYELPAEGVSQVTVGVSDDGVMLVKVPAAARAALDDRHLTLIGLAIGKKQLNIEASAVKSVVIQAEG